MIRLSTLGSIELHGTHGESLDAVLAQPKRLALLAYLTLVRPSGFQRRDVLLAIFWPESDTTHAREALSQALRFLRRFLGSEALPNRGDDVGVDPSRVSCDAVAFEERIAAGDDAGALALYRGPLLEGLFLSEALLFEHWLNEERARLQDLARGAACRLAAHREVTGDLGGALHWARHALAWARYDEAAFRRVLDLLDGSGDRASAVREYEVFAKRLRDELEVDPSPETQAAVERIRARATPNSLPQSARTTPVVDSVPTELASATEVALAPPRRPVLRVARFAAATALLLLGGGGVIIARGGARVEARRILVIPLENRTGEKLLDRVGKIAADWIVQGLARTEVVDVVPSLHALELLQGLDDERALQDTLSRLRALAHAVGAGTVVLGSFYQRSGNLEFEAQVIDVRRGRFLSAVEGVRGSPNDPMVAIDELRRRIVGAVGLSFDPRTFPLEPSAVRPPSYEAYQAFAAGMEQHNKMRWRLALPYFRQAFALDTSFTSALFLAAIQHLNLREPAQAESLVRVFARSRERLPSLERQFLEWIEAELRGDLQGALEAARGLVRFSDAYRNQAAANALSANQPREAIHLYDGFDIEVRPELKWKVNYGWRLTDAYHRLGRHSRELAEANRSRKRITGLVHPVLWELRALIALGRVQRAQKCLEEALAMPAHVDDRPAGEIMVWAADELRVHGHAGVARGILLRGLAWYRALPDSLAALPRHRRYLAATLLRADSLDAAEAALRALAADFPQDPYYTASVAVAVARRGDRRGASDIAATMLDRNPPYDFGHHLYERARVAAQLGNTDEAIELLRRAFANGFNFAFVGGAGGMTAARPPDGSPHLDDVFDGLRAHPGFQALARGTD